MATAYEKVLIAKHSPKNLCFASEGEILIPARPGDEMRGGLPKDDHFFVGTETGLPSRYGWVEEVDNPITAEGLARLKEGDAIRPETVNACEILLKSAARYPKGTPMACHFLEIKLPGEESRKLKVHKVIFHQASK